MVQRFGCTYNWKIKRIPGFSRLTRIIQCPYDSSHDNYRVAFITTLIIVSIRQWPRVIPPAFKQLTTDATRPIIMAVVCNSFCGFGFNFSHFHFSERKVVKSLVIRLH